MIKLIFCSAICLLLNMNTYAQPMRLYYNAETGGSDTAMIAWGVFEVKDTTTGNVFILDSTHTYITALSKQRDTLWKVDPWKDKLHENPHPYYRLFGDERPIIMLMDIVDTSFINSLLSNRVKTIIPGVSLVFDNSQMCILTGENGSYIYMGQD